MERGRSRSKRRNRATLAAAATIAAALIAWLLWQPAPPPPSQAKTASAATPAPASAAPSSSTVRDALQSGTGDATENDAQPAAGADPAVPPAPPPEAFPPTTQPLAEEFRPGTTEWEEVPLDRFRQRVLRILPLRYNVVVPAPIVVLLEITDTKGHREPLHGARVRLRPLDRADAPWIDVPVRDDGSGADAVAGDLQYTATLKPDGATREALLGRVLVEGSADVPGVGTQVAPATLIYTRGPRAHLTGRWSDRAQDGSLYLDAEVEVEEAGLFTLMAQVFGPALEPIAWVKQTTSLGAGRGTITLQVYGKAIYDVGIDGPYRVREVLLSRDHENSSDYDPGVTIEEAHRTRPYRAQDFTGAPYTPPPRAVAEEVTADHPSQQDKPPPLGQRAQAR